MPLLPPLPSLAQFGFDVACEARRYEDLYREAIASVRPRKHLDRPPPRDAVFATADGGYAGGAAGAGGGAGQPQAPRQQARLVFLTPAPVGDAAL